MKMKITDHEIAGVSFIDNFRLILVYNFLEPQYFTVYCIDNCVL
jgi:hypothetical protein